MTHPFFEHSFCINLQRRPDRWNQSNQEFQQLDIPIWWAWGIDCPENSVDALHLTHNNIIQHAKFEEWDHVVIFEDDVHFINNPQGILPLAIGELPSDWDMLYFGGNVDGPCYRTTPHLAKLTHCQSTHAYAIRHTLYDTKLQWETGIIDLIYAHEIIPRHNCYITNPMTAIQSPGYSDIEKKDVNYDWMEYRLRINLR